MNNLQKISSFHCVIVLTNIKRDSWIKNIKNVSANLNTLSKPTVTYFIRLINNSYSDTVMKFNARNFNQAVLTEAEVISKFVCMLIRSLDTDHTSNALCIVIRSSHVKLYPLATYSISGINRPDSVRSCSIMKLFDGLLH